MWAWVTERRSASRADQAQYQAIKAWRKGSEHRFQLVPAGQTVAQPFAEEQIELVLLVRLVHLRVGVVIDAAETSRILGANDFGHTRTVVTQIGRAAVRDKG